jgi:GT2 family glycosyltransferase
MRFTRPPYILAHPADLMGCGYHRIFRPLEIMSRHGYAAGRAEGNFFTDEMLSAIGPDVVVFQRPTERRQTEMIQNYRKVLPHAFFVFEVDDAISAVPERSWHKPHIQPNINDGMIDAISSCDAVSVTTEPLAEHIRHIYGRRGSDLDIRVIPNYLAAEDFEICERVRASIAQARQQGKMHRRDLNGRLKIGWAGGAGHAGDFDNFAPVFEHFRERVDWVFLGFQPIIPSGCHVAFMGAAPIDKYMAAIASMDCDLVIAPLEDNVFNTCKSNLRLLEYGSAGYPIIASPRRPYREGYGETVWFADTAEEWISQIERFIALSEPEKIEMAADTLKKTRSQFCLDDHLQERIQGWLPRNTRCFVPKIVKSAQPFSRANRSSALKDIEWKKGDFLYVRPGVEPPANLLDRLGSVDRSAHVASICFFANEIGAIGFPSQTEAIPIDRNTSRLLDTAAADLAKEGILQPVTLGYSGGPCILLLEEALERIGLPDSTGDQEAALTEWSAMAAARGFKNILFPGAHIFSPRPKQASPDAQRIARRIANRWPQAKCDVEAIASAREAIEIRFHRDQYFGLPPQNPGNYSEWASVCDTPSMSDRREMMEWMKTNLPNPKLRRVTWPSAPRKLSDISGNGVDHDLRHLLTEAAMSEAEWLICHADTTQTSAVFHCFLGQTIKDQPAAAVIFGDHDCLINGKRAGHWFKPQFDHHLLLAKDYITQIVAIKRSALASLLPQILTESPLDEDDDRLIYRIVLGILEANGRDAITHIPRISAHIRPPQSYEEVQLSKARAADKTVIATKHARQMGWPLTVRSHPVLPDAGEIQYFDGDGKPWGDSGAPPISIIIPTKDRLSMIAPCLATLTAVTTYPNYEILVIDNGSNDPEVLKYLGGLSDDRIRIVRWDQPFNWSKLNNMAVTLCGQEPRRVYCFLNDDTRIVAPNWLDEMVAVAILESTGAVGARLTNPHGIATQHVGVVSHHGLNGHLMKGIGVGSPGYNGLAFLSHESSAVTGACLLVRKSVFDEVGGFHEELAFNFGDTAFCLEAMKRGYRNVVCARAELHHIESATRPAADSDKGLSLLTSEGKWFTERYDHDDPYWNPNLALVGVSGGAAVVGLGCDIMAWPAKPWPWRGEKLRQHILLLGPGEVALEEKRSGESVYELIVKGNEIRFLKPVLPNVRALDVRKPEAARRIIAGLGMERIIVSSLLDASPSILSFLTALDLPVEYRPIDAECVCPRRDLTVDHKSCGEGWTKNQCQGCIDANGSPHGHVTAMAWMADWIRFLSNENVSVDLSLALDPEHRKAISSVYFDQDAASNEIATESEIMGTA